MQVWCKALCTATEFSIPMVMMRRSGSIMLWLLIFFRLVITDGKIYTQSKPIEKTGQKCQPALAGGGFYKAEYI